MEDEGDGVLEAFGVLSFAEKLDDEWFVIVFSLSLTAPAVSVSVQAMSPHHPFFAMAT